MFSTIIVPTALSAFFASLAAVAVSMLLDRSSRQRDAKAELLRAIHRHCARLRDYSTEHSHVRTIGVDNGARNKGQFAPFKPPIAILLTELQGTRHYFSPAGRLTVDKIINNAKECEVPNQTRGELADWNAESEGLMKLAEQISQWDGKRSSLPTDTDLGRAPVMS